MRKILKLSAMLIGAAAMLVGLNSCSKGGGGDDANCCSFSGSGTYDGATYTYSGRFCEDGTYTYTYTNGDNTENYSGNWDDNEYTWAEIQEKYC